MKLQILSDDETKAYLVGDTSAKVQVSDFFKFQPEGYYFMPAYQMGRWSGWVQPVNPYTGEFNKGLTKAVIQAIKALGYEVELDTSYNNLDTEIPLGDVTNICDGAGNLIEPYDYQLAGAKHVLDNKRAIVTSPTGSGKSLMQYIIIKSLLEFGHKKILLVVPTVSLVSQMATDFGEYSQKDESFNVDALVHTIQAGSEKDDTAKPIYISTWQSLHRIKDKKYFEQFDSVLVDECLHGDTLVTMSDNTKKKIKDIRPGDVVKTLNEDTLQIENNEVIKLHKNLVTSQSEKMFEIKLDDGNVLKITGNHKVYTRDAGWKRADELKEGDDIIDFNIDNIMNSYNDNKPSASQNISKWFKRATGYKINDKIDFINLMFSPLETSCNFCNGLLPPNKLIMLLRKRRPSKMFCNNDCLYKHRSENMSGDKNNALKMTKAEKEQASVKQSKTLKRKILEGTFTPNSDNRNTNTYIKIKTPTSIINMRSSWEALFYFNNLDKNLQYEKIRIPYKDEHDISRVYITDFYDADTNTIYEVKPEKYINKNSELKRKAVKAQGYNFEYVTEKIIYGYDVQDKLLEQFILNYEEIKHRFIKRGIV